VAFPSTAVLDNFNTGASQQLINPPRTSWSASQPFSAGSFTTNATPTNASSTVAAANMWNASFTDMECFATLSAFTPATATFEVLARIQGPIGSPSMYSVVLAQGATNRLQIYRRVGSLTRVAIGAIVAQTFTNGDSVGISVIGTTIQAWYKVGAGAWTLKDTVTDSSVAGSGRVGIARTGSGTTTIDDFGGGAATAGTLFTKSVTGSAQFAGVRPKIATQTKRVGVLTFAGSEVAHPTARRVTGSFAPTSVLARQLSLLRTLTGALSFSGARTQVTAYVRTLVGAVFQPTGVNTRIKAVSKAVSGALTFVGSISRFPMKTLTVSFTPAGVLNRSLSLVRTVTGAFTPNGALHRLTIRKLPGSVANFVAAFSTAAHSGQLTASFRPTGTVTNTFAGRMVSASLTLAGDLGRDMTRLLVSSLIASSVIHTQYLPPVAPGSPGGGGYGALMSDAHFQRYRVASAWRNVKRVKA
jgi:hypothetical protein